MTEPKVLYKITVRGRVQGVGFRRTALREAESLRICGYVRNMPDGGVYIEAEGTRDQLEKFAGWCNRGPGIGHVDSVHISECPPVGYNDFRVTSSGYW
ncbi:MAG TPA: acylphosphatase [Bacteroidales bacterium]|nr:acylphosphatase [Bacteroidales bacterium]